MDSIRCLLALFFLYILLIARTNADVIEPKDVVIVILSQKEGYHAAHADLVQRYIHEQASAFEKESPKVVLSHKLDIKGSWMITPLLIYLSDTFPGAKWFFFCLENTVIQLAKLLTVLEKFNNSQNMWIGHALYDHEPSIIHHFAKSKKFKYPHMAAGFAMTFKLLNSLARQVSEDKQPKIDFSIDASYEFADFVLKSTNTRLTHVSKICVVSSSDCATYPRIFYQCNVPALEKVFFAVKTCAKYHTERIPVIKNTWAKYNMNIAYFSDIADYNLREAYVVPNTTEGHCAKTYGILQAASKLMKTYKFDWLVIADDDTIFSVARLIGLLTCYNPEHLIAIGERYGFLMWDSRGYQYLTGGAGVVLSAPLVHKIIKPGVCDCPSATTPDDMYLFGFCLSKLGVEPVHSSMFHQARPTDYANAYLALQEPISFHKFWMHDPVAMYEEWFAEADNDLPKRPMHVEL